MRQFFGMSNRGNLSEAVRNLDSPQFIMLLSNNAQFEEHVKALEKLYPGIPSIGCIGMSYDTKVVENDPYRPRQQSGHHQERYVRGYRQHALPDSAHYQRYGSQKRLNTPGRKIFIEFPVTVRPARGIRPYGSGVCSEAFGGAAGSGPRLYPVKRNRWHRLFRVKAIGFLIVRSVHQGAAAKRCVSCASSGMKMPPCTLLAIK